MSEAVSIVGGGVIGLSTGVWLELAGYETRIYTEHRTGGLRPETAPETVASPYAAASIVPHRDTIPAIGDVVGTSTAVYERLADVDGWPVRQQRHVMVHEDDPGDLPALASHVPGFRPLDRSRDPVPTRAGVDPADVSGWALEPFVVSMPEYLERLEDLYLAVGGAIEERTVTRERLGDLPGEAVVNATGLGARTLADDPAVRGARGHAVLVDDADGPTHRGEPYSYNYHRADEPSIGAYAYPREGELVLGGSWIEVDLGPDGRPAADDPPTETVPVDGVDVPAQIVTLNDELLEDVTVDPNTARAAVGVRPIRDGGARVEAEDVAGTTVVHNYGHGGAGVTFSWGAAELVDRLLTDRVSPSGTVPSDRSGATAALGTYVEAVRRQR